jgi:hypothetical protein
MCRFKSSAATVVVAHAGAMEMEQHRRRAVVFSPANRFVLWAGDGYPEVSPSMAIPHAIRKLDKSETYQLSTRTEVHNCVRSRAKDLLFPCRKR